jgi:hypothetical protein
MFLVNEELIGLFEALTTLNEGLMAEPWRGSVAEFIAVRGGNRAWVYDDNVFISM